MSARLVTCHVCHHAVYATNKGLLPKHMPDDRRNDGGDPAKPPRCAGSGQVAR